MNNYESGYDTGYNSGKEDFAGVMDNFCLNILREYEENADTHAKKDEMLNTCFWQGATFALRVIRQEIKKLNE